MKFINQKIGIFFWKLIVAFPINFQNVLANILFSLLKNPNLKRNIFSRKNIDAAFPNLNEQEKRNLFNKNLKSMVYGIFDTGKAWFWNDSKINSLIKYEIFGKVLFLNSYYESDKLILSVEEIKISDSKSMIQDISSHVEARIREKPSEYLWQHRRFKSTMGKESFYEC